MTPRLLKGRGRAEPRGATLVADGVNFSVYSERAERIFVCLFDERGRETARFALDGRAGAVHFGLVSGIGAGSHYGLRAEGPYDPDQGLWFDPHKLLVDPYAKRLDGGFVHAPALTQARDAAEDSAPFVPKAIVIGRARPKAKPLKLKPELIYELNVRGFTKLREDVPADLRGTVSALTEPGVAAHFETLGVNVIELMPVAAWVDDRHLPELGLTNAWGYNPVTFFAPDPRLMPHGMAELREMTDFYRERDVAVVLDVVFNHSGEGDALGPVLSMRGLDAPSYYLHESHQDGRLELVNHTGTGNTLDCAHPEVRRLVLDAMRYWVEAGGVSGFRFDLAPVLGRTAAGFDPKAKLLEEIRHDPLLSHCLLIAEPWDPGPHGYQLGAFGKGFYEWNDRYRDDVRAFWRGDDYKVGVLASRLAGSADIFQHGGRHPADSVNFIAVHDGFTLADVVSYATKHNEANGEANHDGHSHNLSWNCGVEGPTEDRDIRYRRLGDARALLATLFFSRGTPMIQQGDEMGRTQKGNNNAYAQDNEMTWVDWDNADSGLTDFVAQLAKFRRSHPALRKNVFLTGRAAHGVRDVTWLHPDQREMHDGDWHSSDETALGMYLHIGDDELIVWFNRWIYPVHVHCPLPATGKRWRMGFNTDGAEGIGADPGHFALPPRSVVVLVPSD